ncbi:MAG: hypothetical protein JSS53_04255, partial [Proteobacteria bacterium]|nr:hypothetical protein [Pseudomonadota bacterium]
METFDSSDSSVPESYLNLAITSLDRKPDKYESMEAYKSSNEYKSTKVWAYLVSVALKCRKSDLNVDPMIKEAVGKGETVSEGAEKALCAFMAIIAEEALTKKNPVKEKILLCALKKSSELPEGELKNRWHGYIHYLFEKHVDQSKNKDEVREKFNKNYKKYHDTTSLFGYMKSFDVNHSSEMDLDLFIQLIKILQAKDEDIDLAPDVLSELKDSLNQFPFKNAALIAQGLGSESLMIKNQKFLKFDLQNLGELRLYIKTLMTLKNDPGQVQDKINQLAQDFIVEVSNYKNDEKIKATPEHYFDYAKELSDSVINLLKEQSISKETAINSINNQFLNAEFKGRDIDVFLKIIVSLVESQLFLFDDLVGFFKKIASNATLNEDSRYKIYCQWAGYLKYQGKIDDASQVLLQIPIDHIRSEYQKTLELSVNDEVLKESINYLVQPMSSSLAIENNKEADIETLKKLSEKGIPDATFALSFRFATDSENYIKFLNQALTQIKAVPNKAKPLYALLEAGIKIKLAYVYFRGFQNKLNNGTKVYDQDVKDLFMHCCESFGRTKVLPSSDADNFYSLIEKFHSGIKDTHYWTLMLLLYAVNPKLMKEMLLQKPNVISSL